MLVVFSGLPGVGKTAIARELARTIGAVHLRIDSIEQALRRAGCRVEGEGYEVAYAVAARSGVAALDIEIVCSDAAEHRRGVESREPDIPGHALPTWQDVVERDYDVWDRDRFVVDTARSDVPAGVRAIVSRLTAQASGAGPSNGD